MDAALRPAPPRLGLAPLAVLAAECIVAVVDGVRLERAPNPRLTERSGRDGVGIFPDDCPAPASTVAAA